MNSNDVRNGAETATAEADGHTQRFSWCKLAGFCVIMVLVLGGAWLLTLAGERIGTISVTSVADYVKSWGIWGYFGVVGLMIVHSFVPFPAELLAIAAGMCFGAVWGTALTWVGAMAGGLLAFGLSRKLGRPFVADMLAPKQMMRIDGWSNTTSITALIVVRFIPVIAFNLINYAAGLTRVTWWRFTWTTAIGILPITVLMAIAGAQMREPTVSDWLFLIGAGLLILMVVHITRRNGFGENTE